ncbi:MAG: VOC family protein [Balneolaceae bacterium]|nr:VOC family protein [Balneolaceae bacterium]MBO6545153.1 VOC family protein [Balneolaceae bacterium]MBO6646549.1 VOC family protein [Balneolaceae bacterium]
MKKKLSHFAAQFPVYDPEIAANWYMEKLGFDIIFKWGEPVDYIVTNREEAVSIHFIRSEAEKIEPRVIYVFCFDVDAVYEELSSNKIVHITKPINHEYKMRDFEVKDPYGNMIVFGMGIN